MILSSVDRLLISIEFIYFSHRTVSSGIQAGNYFKKFESRGHVGDSGLIGHNTRQAVNTEYGDNCDKEIPAAC